MGITKIRERETESCREGLLVQQVSEKVDVCILKEIFKLSDDVARVMGKDGKDVYIGTTFILDMLVRDGLVNIKKRGEL